MSSIIFNCEFCEYKTKRKYDLNRLQTALHPKNVMNQIKEDEIEEEKNYTCVKCNKKYKTKKSFIHHEQNSNGLNILDI
jgi:hypothetical protein